MMQRSQVGPLYSSSISGGHAPGASLRVASRPPHPAKHALAKPVPPVQGLPKGPVDAIAERIEDPILRTAVKEPVAFWGGIFAGALGLNLEEEPLKSFLERSSGQASDAPPEQQQQQQQSQGEEDWKNT
mmetsp:Transcript_18870/g.52842  ORF Transcript_18870/g.52842 Transcript_18870/m.52842 type:complete len:129 (+) Transcript_18870:47-433(+)